MAVDPAVGTRQGAGPPLRHRRLAIVFLTTYGRAEFQLPPLVHCKYHRRGRVFPTAGEMDPTPISLLERLRHPPRGRPGIDSFSSTHPYFTSG